MKNLSLTFVPALALALSGSAALAHSTLAQSEVTAGATTKLTVRVPHGCDGEATHTVELTLPEGVYNAKPMPKAGWELTTETGAYATPYMNHGTEMTEGVRKVTWSGGNLEDGWYDEFTVRAAIGPDVAPDTILYLPVMQYCADGTADWTDTSGADGVPNPAPKTRVVAGAGHGHGHGHGHGAGHGHDHDAAATTNDGPVVAGDLTLTGGFSRATLPNAPVGGGFLTIQNAGAADRLVAASSDVSERVEIHEMAMDGDVMRMRELPDGLPLPAGETVDLKPGGYHLMFMGLSGALVEGETLEVTLEFENAGEVVVPLLIGAPNAKASDDGGMQHDHGHMTETDTE